MSNNVGQTLYAYERQALLSKIVDQVYALKFHSKNLYDILTALSDAETLATKCEQMAITADDTEFEQVCRDLPQVLEDARASLLREDSSSRNQLEVARKIEAAIPLVMRDPTAYARSQIVHRYSVIHENENEHGIDSVDVLESEDVPEGKGAPANK